MRVDIKRVEPDGKITLQEGAGIAIVTINRPPSKNAMTVKMWSEMTKIADEILKNPKNRVVIVRGSKGLFSAGSDIEEFSRMEIKEVNEAFRQMELAISAFEQLPLPTIGLINGPSLGAGFELALACDIRVGTPETRMGIPVGSLGITLSNKFVKRIVDLVGPSKMKDFVYTGKIIGPDTAYQWGLVNYLIKKEIDPNNYTLELAKKIQSQSAASILAVKQGVALSNPAIDLPVKSDFKDSVDPTDFPEGINAFLEKRKPNFKK